MSEHPGGIIAIIKHCGEANVELQPLDSSMKRVDFHKNGDATVAFVTESAKAHGLIHDEAKMRGFVLWLPAEGLESFIKAFDALPAAPQKEGDDAE